MTTADPFALEVWGHQPDLLQFTRRLTRNPTVAEDLTSETILRALAKRALFLGGNLLGWLKTIARHLWLDVARHRRRHGGEVAVDPDLLADLGETAPAQEWPLHLRQIEAAIAGLGFRHRQVILLIVFLGMRYEDAAPLMGVSVGTAKRHLHNARRRLAERTGW